MNKIKSTIISISLLTTNQLILAEGLSAEAAMSKDGENAVNNKETSVKKEIKDTLGDYYIESGNIKQKEEQKEEETIWVPVSAPYDCTAWTLNTTSGNEERTCKVKKSNISTVSKVSEINQNILKDFDLKYNEKEDSILQIRVVTAPTPPPPVTTPPPARRGTAVTGIEVTLNAPATAGLGEEFTLSWSSKNAITCSVPQHGLKGGQGNEGLSFITLGDNRIKVTCSDGVDLGSEEITVNIVPIPLELNIISPLVNAEHPFGTSYQFSWKSKGANSCSYDGRSYSSAYINYSVNMNGPGIPKTHTVTCTNGTDSITKSVSITSKLGPPPNGDCTWGAATDTAVGVNYPFPYIKNNVISTHKFYLKNRQTARMTSQGGYCGLQCGSYKYRDTVSQKRTCTTYSVGRYGRRTRCFMTYCRRSYGSYYHDLSCINGVVIDRYNSDSCNSSSYKRTRSLQDFNRSVWSYSCTNSSYSGWRCRRYKEVWKWPN